MNCGWSVWNRTTPSHACGRLAVDGEHCAQHAKMAAKVDAGNAAALADLEAAFAATPSKDPPPMTYAILQISAAAYRDIRARLVAIDERIGDGLNQYQRQYIRPPSPACLERLAFGDVAFEALPEPLRKPPGWPPYVEPAPHVDDLNDAGLVGLALEDDARALFGAFGEIWSFDGTFDALGPVTKAAYLEAARVMRERYVPVINAAEAEAAACHAEHEVDIRRRQEAETDAARWRALLNAEPNALGWAGVELVDGVAVFKPREGEGNYVHVGINFTTYKTNRAHQASHVGLLRDRARSLLTVVADILVANGGKPLERVETPARAAPEPG
jgi:hypothetical protein